MPKLTRTEKKRDSVILPSLLLVYFDVIGVLVISLLIVRPELLVLKQEEAGA
jgi:hypothetical protein